MGRPFGFPAKNRLKSRKSIEAVFASGKSLMQHPLLAKFVVVEENARQLLAGFSVPRRNFRKAVERNRIKRLMCESFRLNRPVSLGSMDDFPGLHIMFVYLDRKMTNQEEVSSAMAKLLSRLRTAMSAGSGNQ